MKFLRYFLLISLLWSLLPIDAAACEGPYFLPGGYRMFRGYDAENTAEKDAVKENCLAWQHLTSKTIPLKDISFVVYKMSYEEYVDFYHNGGYNNNKFAQWIGLRDSEIKDFLMLAKTNEFIRFKRSSSWYYPTMRTGAPISLEDVVNKALAHTSPRLRDRYLLQAVRALFSLGRYEECARLWEEEISKLPQDNAMRKLTQPYIAGAEFHLGHREKSLQYYAELGDYESVEYCAKKLGKELSIVEIIELLYKYNPTSSSLEELVHNTICTIEIWLDDGYAKGYYSDEERSQIAQVYNIVNRIATEGKVKNRAMWYYTTAFLIDLQGEPLEASHMLQLAEKADGTSFIKESIKVMRIYLDAKTLPYDNAYEQKLFAQLQWLDGKIKSNITPEVREKTSKKYYSYLGINKSYYYWNDVMRRILLAEVCPRMIEQGKQVRALQLANMADNRLLGLVNKIETYNLTYQDKDACCISTGGGQMIEMPLNEFRRSTQQFNHLDYRNDFFILIDSIGVDNVIAYYGRVMSPKTDFDRFLNARGYVDRDYLLDIVGTQCLRNMRYADAEKYLGAINPSFYGHLNVCQIHIPFELDNVRKYNDTDFRYQFAKEMNALERKITATTNPDEKAQAMLRFAIGLRNSFGKCWSLTQYAKNSSYTYRGEAPSKWLNSPEKHSADTRADELIKTTCNLVTDREYAAKIQYDFCNFREVATRYYDTQMARAVWGKCDQLIDYHAER